MGENRVLHVNDGMTGIRTFFCGYIIAVSEALSQVKVEAVPQTSLAIARMKQQALKFSTPLKERKDTDGKIVTGACNTGPEE